jgi:hypothetical protein
MTVSFPGKLSGSWDGIILDPLQTIVDFGSKPKKDDAEDDGKKKNNPDTADEGEPNGCCNKLLPSGTNLGLCQCPGITPCIAMTLLGDILGWSGEEGVWFCGNGCPATTGLFSCRLIENVYWPPFVGGPCQQEHTTCISEEWSPPAGFHFGIPTPGY